TWLISYGGEDGWPDVLRIVLGPAVEECGHLRGAHGLRPGPPVHCPAQPLRRPRSVIELQPGIAPATFGQDRHDGPVTTAKGASKRLFISATAQRGRPAAP